MQKCVDERGMTHLRIEELAAQQEEPLFVANTC